MLVHFSENKLAYVIKGLKQTSDDLSSLIGSLAINEISEDLETTLGSQTPMDLNPGPGSELCKQLRAIQVALSSARTQFIKDLLGPTGQLIYNNPDDYEIDMVNKYTTLKTGFVKNAKRIDDFDYKDQEIVDEAFERFVTAKELFYDKNYADSEDEVFLKEKAAKLDELLRVPIAAYYISATRSESTRDILVFVEMLFETNKFKTFINDVNDVIKENREDEHDDNQMLKELLEDSAFRGRIFSVSTRYKETHLKEMHPHLGKFMESLKEVLDLDENYEKREKEKPEDEDFDDWV